MSEKAVKFDANLVGVFDRELGKDTEPELSGRFYLSNPPVEFDSRLLEALGSKILDLDKQIEENQIPREAMDVIQKGRLQIGMLISMPGGYKHRGVALGKFIDKSKENGSTLETYAGTEASSQGAILWQIGEIRNVLERSKLFWHTSKVEYGELLMEMTETEREDSLATNEDSRSKELHEEFGQVFDFLKPATQPYRESFLYTLFEDVNQRHELSTTGSLLYAAGLATNSFSNSPAMKQFFEAGFNWADGMGSRVDEFWQKMLKDDNDFFAQKLLTAIFGTPSPKPRRKRK